MKQFFLLALVLVSFAASASTGRYRLMFNDDPSSIITIGWEQVSGSNPEVYFGTTDHGTNWAAYPNSITPYKTTNYMGMTNMFAKITGLQANTAYYFVIKDSEGTGNRYWFKTCPDVNTEALSFISGGDSRSGQTQRQNSNKMVAKIRPHAVLFGGDLVNTPGNSSVQTWLDDWAFATTSDDQMIPLVHSFGNHEEYGSGGAYFLRDLFDVTDDAYYNVTFGGDLFSMYTLNGEVLPGHTISNSTVRSAQTAWLSSTLTNDNSIWKAAQYHRPIVPHYSGKGEGADEFNDWAQLFYDNEVRLVMESDAHVVKVTEEVKPANSTASGNSSNWFTTTGIDPEKGITFIGEGSWGTIRTPDDSHPMTVNMGSFYSFNWIIVDACKIEVRTIDTQSPNTITEHAAGDHFSISPALEAVVWKPSGMPTGVVEIIKCNPPDSDFNGVPTSIFTGQSVDFTDLSTNTPTSWNWNFGDGATSTAQNPTHIYSAAGTYTVTLDATNGDGTGSETKTDYIVVSDPVAPTADFVANITTAAVGQGINFTDLSIGNPDSWNWNFGDGGTSTAQNPTHVYNTPGVYTVTLTVSNIYGSDDELKTNYIDIQNGGSVTVTVSNGSDDAEEDIGGTAGGMYLTSSDLEIGNDLGDEQYMAVRFNNLNVPQGATITNAKITFRADETDFSSSQMNIYIDVEDVDNSSTFSATPFDISSRSWTSMITWPDGTIPGWNSGNLYDTPDLISLVQAIVDRPGWVNGNSMSFRFYSDLGESSERVADSYEGGYPAELSFDWSVPNPPAPIANLNSSATTVCLNESIDFTDVSTNIPTSWSWDFGDGATSSVQNPTHSYSNSGTYTVTLTATNSGGSDVITMTNYITVNAAPPVDAGTDISICEGSSINLIASGATSYSWDNGLGSGNNHLVSPIATTTYEVTGTTSNCSATDLITITVDQNGNSGISNPIIVCINDNAVDLFSAISGEDAGGSWLDSDNTGQLSGSSLNATTLTAGNTYNFEYVIAANGACPSTSTFAQITVEDNVSAGIGTATTICANENTFDLFTALNGYSNGGSWSDDDASNALSSSTFDATSVNAGSYNFTYFVSSTGCGSDTETLTITVAELPVVTTSGDQTICEGETVQISATGATSFAWDNNLGNGASHDVTPTQTTTYEVTGTDINGCSEIATTTITVNALPIVTLDVFENDTICRTNGAVLLPDGNPTGGTYSGNGVVVPNFDPSLTANGSHEIVYSYLDMNGCENSDSQFIVVTECLGISEGNQTIFNLYPNPAKDYIIIERTNPSEYNRVFIYNAAGQLVSEVLLTQNPQKVETENWTRGNYTIVLTGENNQEIVRKIILN